MSQPANAYRKLSIESATPLGLVVMLYDGAIAAMRRAAAAIERNDVQTKCTQMNRALAIIAQLEGTLNFELGGEVAQTLKSLYVYTRGQALKANIENSPEILRSLIANLTIVREAWYEADHQPAPATPAGEETTAPSPATGGNAASPQAATSPAIAVDPSPFAPTPATPRRGGSPYGPAIDPEHGSWRVSA